MIKFSNIPDKLKYPPAVKAKLSMMHSMIIEAATATYTGKYSQRKRIIDAINLTTASVLNGDAIPSDWSPSALLTQAEIPDTSELKSVLKGLFVVEKDVEWDILPNYAESGVTVSADPIAAPTAIDTPLILTPKENLYIQAPVVPRFSNVPWIAKTIGTTTYAIYPSEPAVPTKQNEISVTTDVQKMTTSDLLKLFPNQLIQTRSASMYSRVSGLDYNPELGVVFPIEGYSSEQVIRNIIEYPHLYKLQKQIGDKLDVFYTTIEIDGELHDIQDVWHSAPDMRQIPWTPDFIKEYVVRRYLLERDSGMKHNYPLYGDLDPFLTLFASISKYREWGYDDSVELARKCVQARVRYKRSRNPVLRRLQDE